MNEELISKEQAIESIKTSLLGGIYTEDEEREAYNIAWHMLASLPVVKSDIIHCKDCRYSNDKEFPVGHSGYTRCIRPTFSFWMPEDGFCSYGERSKK